MKQFSFMPVVLLAMIFFASCSNDEVPGDEAKEVPVTFSISTLNVDTQPMSRSTNSGAEISDVVNSITYYIFDSNDKYVKSGSISFTPGVDEVPPGFGTIVTNLMPGDYNILFYALGKGSGYCSFVNYERFNYDSYFSYYNREAFYYTGSLTVSTTSNNHSVSLSRKSGLLRISISDELLSTVSKVVYSFTDSYRWYPKNSATYRREYSFDGSTTDNKMDLFEYYFTFPDALASSSVDVKISIYDTNNALIGEKKIVAPIYENRRTTISGDLFSSLGDQNMEIIIDDVWGEDVNVPIE